MKHILANILLRLFPRTTSQIIETALEHYKESQTFQINVAGKPIIAMSLAELELMNNLDDLETFTIELSQPWRT